MYVRQEASDWLKTSTGPIVSTKVKPVTGGDNVTESEGTVSTVDPMVGWKYTEIKPDLQATTPQPPTPTEVSYCRHGYQKCRHCYLMCHHSLAIE